MSLPPPSTDQGLRLPLAGLLTVGLVTLLASLVLLALWDVFGNLAPNEPRARVGILRAVGHAPLAIARARGDLDAGRSLLVEFGSYEDLRNAFLDGNVHAAILPLDDALRLTGPPRRARVLRFVGYSREPLVLLSRTDGPRLADLRHRSVGLESGRRSMGALASLLARAGLRPEDVELRLVDEDGAPLVLPRGGLDAALVPLRSGEFGGAGSVQELARCEPEAPGELRVLVASAEAIRLAGRQLAYVSAAWDSGALRLRNGRADDAQWLAGRSEQSPETVRAELDRVSFLTADEARAVRAAGGAGGLTAQLARIDRRWKSIGVTDSMPAPELWLSAGAGVRP